jgi:hypothetical protein
VRFACHSRPSICRGNIHEEAPRSNGFSAE